MKTGPTRKLLLISLVVAVVLMALCQAALATAATSFTVNEVNKAGTAQQIGTWTYDSTSHTLTGAPFVQTLTSTDAQGTTLPYVPYSGQDSFASSTKMAVATKGFYIDDLASYVAAATGIPLGSDTSFNVTCSDTSGNFYYATPWTLASADSRYWYPSYNFSATPSTATWDDSTRVARKAVLAIVGNSQRRSSVSPTAVDYSTLLTALGNIATSASDDSSMTLYIGQTKGNYSELNLGSNAAKYVNSLTFTPAYLTITPNVAGGGGTATITTDDGFMKATAGEPVSFTVSNVQSGYTVDSVAVTDAGSQSVPVSNSSGTYSFTMPASNATIAVSLVTPTPLDLAGASIAAIPAQTYTGSVIKPTLTVTHRGSLLAAGTDYTVAYASNSALGVAKATVTGIGTCTGTKSTAFLIIPGKATLRAVTAGRGAATVTWKRAGGGVSGYKVAYRAKGAATFKSAGVTSSLCKVVRNLRHRGTYAFRVCAYKVIGGKTYCGSWSRSMTATVK